MGRPTNKRYFGTEGANDIQVHTWNRPGTGSADGAYVLRQKSENIFTIKVPNAGDATTAVRDPYRTRTEIDLRLTDSGGNTSVLPKGDPFDNNSSDPLPDPYGEFKILVKDSNGDVGTVSKLFNNAVIIRKSDGSYTKKPWSKLQDDAHLFSNIDSVSESSDTVTINTKNEHFLKTGNTVTIDGVAGTTVTNINGEFSITVTGSTSFTYSSTGSAIASYTDDTGTVTKVGREGDEGYAYMELE